HFDDAVLIGDYTKSGLETIDRLEAQPLLRVISASKHVGRIVVFQIALFHLDVLTGTRAARIGVAALGLTGAHVPSVLGEAPDLSFTQPLNRNEQRRGAALGN